MSEQRRWVLGIEYDGSGFCGWQWQRNGLGIQTALEEALSKVANQAISVQCAGRTDAGVHALEQVVHFDTSANRPESAWLLGGNSHLPPQVRITWVKPAIADFHARYSAIARLYRYVILNRPVRSALLHSQTTWCYAPLDAEAMHTAAQSLVGSHDFSSFRAAGCESKSPLRNLYFIEVQRQADCVIIEVSANAFLHHMVRNIAGVLIEIGAGRQAISWTEHLLAVKDRTQAAVTAPPEGLYLASVFYPKEYGIAAHSLFNKLPSDAKRFD
jgi:tRNA pseudouridine38-40 synthase